MRRQGVEERERDEGAYCLLRAQGAEGKTK
jgi:hypothetical protein